MYEQIIQYRPQSPVYASGNELPPKYESKVGLLSDTHLHKEYEFLYVTSGVLKCVTPDDEIYVNGGEVLFINSYTPHQTFNETDCTYAKLLQFNSPIGFDSSFHYITRFLNYCDTPAYVFKPDSEYYDEIIKCIDIIISEHSENRAFWKDYINANIFMLTAILRRCGILSDYIQLPEIDKIMPAIEYINSHYNESITTADLSQVLNFNESYFCRLFKKTIGTTATEYLNFVRVCKAENLIKAGESISDVAYNSGFASLSYFNRIFKKYKHYTPSEYREIVKNREYGYKNI